MDNNTNDLTAQKFGLPSCLWIPIASSDINSIEKYVGNLLEKRIGQNGRINAMLIKPHKNFDIKSAEAKLWQEADSSNYKKIFHPDKQVWVHLDYKNYREAYFDFGMPVPKGDVLDHVQNRKAIRLRGYSHPYLRLCPIPKKVNTNAGGIKGGEGLEKDHVRRIKDCSIINSSKIIYADQMDLTKMLCIEPGTFILNGVRDTQDLFYP